MIEDLVTRAADRDDDAVDALSALAAADPAVVAPFLPRLLAANVSWRPVLYRGADDTVRREIVARIDSGAGARLHDLLLALAHAGGPIAEQAFRRWAERPPPDAGLLHRGPADYPPLGGWSLEADGVRRLCGETAVDLVVAGPADLAQAADQGRAAAPVRPADGGCRWCGSPLWTALDVDTADPRVADALAHTGWAGRLRLVTCHSCACHGPVLCRVSPDGTAAWSELNREPEFLTLTRCDPPRSRLVPGGRRTGPYPVERPATVAGAIGGDGTTDGGTAESSIGGFPGRLPASGHPTCPICERIMAYIATVRAGESYAVFLDTGCGLAAVRHTGDLEPAVSAPGSEPLPGHGHGHGHGHGEGSAEMPAAQAPVLLPFPRFRPAGED